ncbi:MAG: DUF2795 domain-containing protein [Mycobacteriales bacterium]
MERGSDKHGRRLDEALKGETDGMMRAGRDTRAEEWKSAEPSGEDEPEVDRVPNGTLTGGVPAGMTADDVEGRTQLASHLHRSVFPCGRDGLLQDAVANSAPEAVLDQLRQLPEQGRYATVSAVWVALGHAVEGHRA